MNVKVVLLPQGEDPDSFAKKQNAENFHRYISEMRSILFVSRHNSVEEVGTDPIKRAGMISNVVESIAFIPNSHPFVLYPGLFAVLNIQERVLIAEITKSETELREKEGAGR